MAGCCLAEKLLEKGCSPEHIVILHAPGRFSPASSAPSAILHPLTGRTLKPKARVLEAHKYAADWLKVQQASSSRSFVQEIPVLRPFISDNVVGKRLKKSMRRVLADESLPKLFEALSGEEVAKRCPFLAPSDGGALILSGYAVELSVLNQEQHRRLQEAGVTFIRDELLDFHKVDEHWTLQGKRDALLAHRMVLAVGSALGKWLPIPELEEIHGELLELIPAQEIILNEVVSFGGHVAPGQDESLFMGSTYYGAGETPSGNPVQVEAMLKEKIQFFWPSFSTKEILNLWGGARSVYRKDYTPIVGEFPERKGLFVLGALASKGLLWTAFLAEQLSSFLLTGVDDIPSEVNVKRLGVG